MTAEDLEDNDGHVCAEYLVSPRKWCWIYFPAIVLNFFMNISRCFVGMFTEFSEAFQAHGMYKSSRTVNKDVVRSFREQLAEL